MVIALVASWQVYITCSVILCESTSPFSRCAKGCLKEPSRRRRRSALSNETDRHSITQGPLLFVGQALPEAEGDENDAVVMDSDPHNVVMINSTPGVETNVVTPDVKIDRPVEGLNTIRLYLSIFLSVCEITAVHMSFSDSSTTS